MEKTSWKRDLLLAAQSLGIDVRKPRPQTKYLVACKSRSGVPANTQDRQPSHASLNKSPPTGRMAWSGEKAQSADHPGRRGAKTTRPGSRAPKTFRSLTTHRTKTYGRAKVVPAPEKDDTEYVVRHEENGAEKPCLTMHEVADERARRAVALAEAVSNHVHDKVPERWINKEGVFSSELDGGSVIHVFRPKGR